MTLRFPLFLIALAGLCVSGYLAITYFTGGSISCGAAHGCETVRASQYASFFGVPTPWYGILFYFILAILAIAYTPEKIRQWRMPLLVWTNSGFLVSAFLTYIEAFVIDAWCRWCVVSAVLSTLAAVLVWVKLARLQPEPQPTINSLTAPNHDDRN